MSYQEKPLVIHVVISLDTGGLERFVVDLIKASSCSYASILVVLERPGAMAPFCDDIEIISLDMNPGFHISAIFMLADIINKRKAILVHTHNEKAQLYGAIASKLVGVPVVHTKHGKNQIVFRTRLRNKIASLFCNVIVAVSADAAEQCIKDEKVCKSKVRTILNGINTELFKSVSSCNIIRKEFNIPPGMTVIGTVARLAPVKDQATLLEACNILSQKGIDFKLLLIGDGPLRKQLEEQSAAIGFDNTVVFAGMRNDIPALMNVMDIFALSSISEGISLTLLEAMACGLPVVATAVGGNPEVVLDGETGYLVPPQNPDEMAKKLMMLIINKNLRRQMGEKGQERVIANFSLKESAQNYTELYCSVLNKKLL